ncbi:MAG: hypothetical protein ACR2MW_05240 [Chthoniobacterales bacterium]
MPSEIRFLNKLSFPFQFFLRSPSDILLIAGFIGFAVRPWWRRGWRQWTKDRDLSVLLLLLPFLFIGSWAPMLSYRQYYYPFVPFLLLGNVIGLARAPSLRPQAPRFLWLTAFVSLAESLFFIPGSLAFYDYSRWPVFAAHARGEALAALAPRGRVLTLAPIFPWKAAARFIRNLPPARLPGGPLRWWIRNAARLSACSRRRTCRASSPRIRPRQS